MSRYERRLYELRREAALAAAQAEKTEKLIQKRYDRLFNRLHFLLALLPISAGLMLQVFDIQLQLTPLLWFVATHASASSNPELTVFLLNTYIILTPVQAILFQRTVAISLRRHSLKQCIQGIILASLFLAITLIPMNGGYKTKLSTDFQICWVLPLFYGWALPFSITLLINSIVKIFVVKPNF